ncbi:MAG: HAD family phosphatase [Deltaproteobacteria bacterium]|nr:HAD family phosphatase [Deltaproteobacteria bacterium]
MSDAPVRALVFDLGGVVVDWDPRHLYRKLFPGDEPGMQHFLTHVCSAEWNARQDAGRSFAEGIAELQARHPEHAGRIAAYWERWDEMLPGPIPGAPELLRELHAAAVPLYALSNWSAETWPRARGHFDFWECFEGVVISGEIRLAKPDPAIFRHLLESYAVDAATTLFIDDADANVEAARAVGLQALRFTSVPQLRRELRARGVACRPD